MFYDMDVLFVCLFVYLSSSPVYFAHKFDFMII